jgi:hypothetical protein
MPCVVTDLLGRTRVLGDDFCNRIPQGGAAARFGGNVPNGFSYDVLPRGGGLPGGGGSVLGGLPSGGQLIRDLYGVGLDYLSSRLQAQPASGFAGPPAPQETLPALPQGSGPMFETYGRCGPSDCSCQYRPGPCDPAWIDEPGDPRYPRLTYGVNPANGDPVRKFRPARRKPRMNPANSRAAGRAARRLAAAGRAYKRMGKSIKAASRAF